MEHEVQVLQRDRRVVAERQQPQVRVGAYCRVSTEMEEQQSSLDLQIKTFKEQIALHAGWTLVDIYADDGVSGTMASKRTEFQRMIQDCRDGKIDYIITKSIRPQQIYTEESTMLYLDVRRKSFRDRCQTKWRVFSFRK